MKQICRTKRDLFFPAPFSDLLVLKLYCDGIWEKSLHSLPQGQSYLCWPGCEKMGLWVPYPTSGPLLGCPVFLYLFLEAQSGKITKTAGRTKCITNYACHLPESSTCCSFILPCDLQYDSKMFPLHFPWYLCN